MPGGHSVRAFPMCFAKDVIWKISRANKGGRGGEGGNTDCIDWEAGQEGNEGAFQVEGIFA